MALLEQQVDVKDIHQLPQQNKKVRVHKAFNRENEIVSGLQVKLFPMTTSLASQRRFDKHKKLLNALKRRFPSVFTDSYIQIQEVRNIQWVVLNGLNSVKEAAIYCQFFSIQSVDCKKLLLKKT
ncbi:MULTISPECIES: hypothetical protein [unclassified Pseudoalteromonas]|uniref:hypothetical protein n=1 Tax=unclassified Pseudoalteromonas TaxID=194690 RepID=UPI0030145E2D